MDALKIVSIISVVFIVVSVLVRIAEWVWSKVDE